MAAKNLVIVESPAKAKTLEKYLGRDFQVKASVGHVVDLPKSKLGVDVKKNFAPDFTVILSKKKVRKKIFIYPPTHIPRANRSLGISLSKWQKTTSTCTGC